MCVLNTKMTNKNMLKKQILDLLSKLTASANTVKHLQNENNMLREKISVFQDEQDEMFQMVNSSLEKWNEINLPG